MPWGLVGMAVLVLSVEGFVARNELQFSTRITAAWRFSARAASRNSMGAEVLCFGDSLVKLGVLPRVLEHGIGRPVYNLAAPGGQAPTSYYLLRRALASRTETPKAIIVDFHPNLLAVAPRSSGPLWPELVNLRECFDLSIHARDPSLLLETTLACLFPTIKDRIEVRAATIAALEGKPRPGLIEMVAHLHNWQANLGAQVTPRTSQIKDLNESTGQEQLAAWQPHRANTVFVRRFLDLAAERRIKVFWLLPPTSPAWQDRRDRLNLTAQYTRYARQLQSQYPNLVIVDGQHAGYDRSVFRDATHLDRKGALTLSLALVDVIGAHLDGRLSGLRWVDLPGYRERSDVVPLEDVDQSRLVLQERNTKRQ
ncbi:MAG: hypothetical protein ABI353_15145 [Isosphaeraceae bacterium]